MLSTCNTFPRYRNLKPRGDDSSTPKDMAQSAQKLLIENNVLSQENQHILRTWMMNNTTGYKKIRYGLPLGWSAAEKTGGGSGTIVKVEEFPRAKKNRHLRCGQILDLRLASCKHQLR